MLNVKVVSWSLAVWGGIIFVVCIVYGLLVPGAFQCIRRSGRFYRASRG